MSSILFDAVVVNVNLADKIASAPSLDIAMVFDPDMDETSTNTITNLTQGFVSEPDLILTFPRTEKVAKCANSHYTQPGHNPLFKVARTTTTDSNITDSLDKIFAQDKDFFQLLTTSKVQADITEISNWCRGKNIAFGSSVEPDANALDSGSVADLASSLAATNNENTFINSHHESGVDVTGVSITTASEVATVTRIAHGLRVSNPLTVSGAADIPLNGDHTVLAIVDDDNFTYTASGAADGADANNASIDYYARYLFIESGFQGFQLGKDIGTSSWAYKAISGQAAIPKTILNDSQIQVLRDKNYVTYTNPQNNISVTSDGFMVTGRQIVDEDVRIWLELNIATSIFNVQIANEKIPYTNPGFELIRSAIVGPLKIQLTRGGLNPLDDIQDFIIELPNALSALPANRQQGIMAPIEVTARIGSAVLKITVNVTLIV